jgi:hypothetical protein
MCLALFKNTLINSDLIYRRMRWTGRQTGNCVDERHNIGLKVSIRAFA